MKPLALIAVAGLAAALPALPAAAQPGGSYRDSCRNQRLEGPRGDPVLTAECKIGSGPRRTTSIRLNGCQGDIANVNGQLVCSQGGGAAVDPDRDYGGGRGRDRDDRYGGGRGRDRDRDGGIGAAFPGRGGQLPGGSWRQSCTGGAISRGVLTARCDNGNGKRRDTSLDVRQCQTGRVGNSYGRLACE